MSRFTAHLGLELIEGGEGRPLLTRDGRCQWRLSAALTYDVGAKGSGETITVPVGACTDLGSIPQLAWSLGFSPDGAGTKAFVIHDFLYRTLGGCMWNGARLRSRAAGYSRREADAILREALGVLGVGRWSRTIIWAAVRIGGGKGWGG